MAPALMLVLWSGTSAASLEVEAYANWHFQCSVVILHALLLGGRSLRLELLSCCARLPLAVVWPGV